MATIQPPHITEADVLAIRAVADGVANAAQAKLAFDWVMREACRFMTVPMLELPPNATAEDMLIGEGRRVVGQLIRNMFLDATLENAEKSASNATPVTKPTRRGKKS